MKKKKILLLLTTTVLSASAVAAIFLNGKNDASFKTKAEDPLVLELSASNVSPDENGDFTVSTISGNPISFKSSGLSIVDGKLSLAAGGYILNPYDENGDHNKISGIYNLAISYESGKVAVDYTWGESLRGSSPYYQRRDITWPVTHPSFGFLDESPNYVKMFAKEATVLNSFTFTYACSDSGEKGENLQINSPTMLERFKTTVNWGNNFEGQIVELIEDVDMKGVTMAPIGNNSYPFKGTFEGNNHSISNLTISGSTMIATFGNVVDGTIQNLNINNVNVSASGQRAAGAVARAQRATIKNVHVNGGTITGSQQNAGIAGIGIDSIYVEGCTNSATVTGTTGNGNAGIVGYNYTSCQTVIYDCDNFGNISAPSSKIAGGILGGFDPAGHADITLCEVGKNASVQVGGVEATAMKAANGVIAGSTNANVVLTTCGKVNHEISSVADYNEFVTAAASSPYYANSVAMLTADLDFENTGTVITRLDGMIDGNGHTISNLTLSGTSQVGLIGNCTNGAVKHLKLDNIHSTASGTRASALFGRSAGGYLKDVEVLSGEIIGAGQSGGLVGVVVTKATCIDDCINRANVSVSNVTSETLGVGGLVGTITSTAASLIVKHSKNYGNVSSNVGSIGGLVGYASSFTSSDVIDIEDSINYGSVSTTAEGSVVGLGGVFGYLATVSAATSIKLINCKNYGSVVGTNEYTAGVFGGWQTKPTSAAYIVSMDITGCENHGDVTTTSGNGCGGIIAATNSVQDYLVLKVQDCKNFGSISGSTYVGGIAGLVRNASSSNESIIDNCYNYGNVEAKGGSSAAGIAGEARINLTNCGCYSESTLKNKTTSYLAKNRAETGTCGYITFTYTSSSVNHTGNRLVNLDGSNY